MRRGHHNLLLTPDSTEGRKPGRPPAITDQQLLNRQDQIQQRLEFYWALVGWQLRNASCEDDLRTALHPIPEAASGYFRVFLRNPVAEVSGSSLKELRAHFERAEDEARAAHAALRCTEERADCARRAVLEVANTPEAESMSRLSDQEQRACEAARAAWLAADRARDAAQHALDDSETCFALGQLLQFKESKRYHHEPYDFANAMAGLPLIGWKVSSRRCRKSRKSFHGVTYQAFRIVEKLLGTRTLSAADACARLKEYLESHGKGDYVHDELRKHWYSLRCAIESEYSAHVPDARIPFLVFAEYQKRICSLSAAAQIRLEQEELSCRERVPSSNHDPQ